MLGHDAAMKQVISFAWHRHCQATDDVCLLYKMATLQFHTYRDHMLEELKHLSPWFLSLIACCLIFCITFL